MSSRRIDCLSAETVETLYLLGEQQRIVGISGFARRPPRAWREKPRIAAFASARIDAILTLDQGDLESYVAPSRTWRWGSPTSRPTSPPS